MPTGYQTTDQSQLHYLTFQVVYRIDVFSRKAVSQPEDYIYSSARNYADMESVIDIDKIALKWKTVR